MHFCSFFPRPTSFLDVPGNSRGSLLAEHTKYHQCPIPKDVCDKKQAFNISQQQRTVEHIPSWWIFICYGCFKAQQHRVFNKSQWPVKFTSYFRWNHRLLFFGNYPCFNRVFMCCHWIKKPKFNDVCVLFEHSYFCYRMLEMHSKRPRFQTFSRNSHLCHKFLPSPPTPKLLPST